MSCSPSSSERRSRPSREPSPSSERCSRAIWARSRANSRWSQRTFRAGTTRTSSSRSKPSSPGMGGARAARGAQEPDARAERLPPADGVARVDDVGPAAGRLPRPPVGAVVVLAGGSLRMAGPVFRLARELAPSLVVLEDVDLVGEERTTMPAAAAPVLFELLNEL